MPSTLERMDALRPYIRAALAGGGKTLRELSVEVIWEARCPSWALVNLAVRRMEKQGELAFSRDGTLFLL